LRPSRSQYSAATTIKVSNVELIMPPNMGAAIPGQDGHQLRAQTKERSLEDGISQIV
jgi:hypothetical protein